MTQCLCLKFLPLPLPICSKSTIVTEKSRCIFRAGSRSRLRFTLYEHVQVMVKIEIRSTGRAHGQGLTDTVKQRQLDVCLGNLDFRDRSFSWPDGGLKGILAVGIFFQVAQDLF